MAPNFACWILHMKQFQNLMYSGSSPPHRYSSYPHPPPSLHPDQFGRLELEPTSRRIVPGHQSDPLKIVPGSQDVPSAHRPVSARTCPAVVAPFALPLVAGRSQSAVASIQTPVQWFSNTDKWNSAHFKETLPMPNTTASFHLPEALRSGNSALVKLAGKVDSFSLVLWQTPESQLKRQIEKDYHAMVFTTRKEVRRYCPKYRHFPGEGILDFSTDCASGQLEAGDLGKPPQPKRGRLCQQCCFFLGEPEEQVLETTVSDSGCGLTGLLLTSHSAP